MMFESMYQVKRSEREVFGSRWVGPAVLSHGGDDLVATYPATGDGVAVDVFCSAMPARFYTLRGFGFEIRTGSGQHIMASGVAEALSNGMLSIAAAEQVADSLIAGAMEVHRVE